MLTNLMTVWTKYKLTADSDTLDKLDEESFGSSCHGISGFSVG